MGHTFAEKILARNVGLSAVEAGQVIDGHPDVVLSHDNTAAIIGIWEQLGCSRVTDPDRMAIVLDHASPAPSTRHAQNHARIRRFVAEQGIQHFFDVGKGICHQVLAEEGIALPGKVILGADSHTTHYGALGAFGAGIGRSEVAAIWATGVLWLRVPESIKIVVNGDLGEWVSAKDLALHIVGRLGADGGNYCSVEFHGSTIDSLSMESRFVLPNMMAEIGAKNCWLAADAVTEEWLATRSQSRGQAAQGATSTLDAGNFAAPDPDADYLAEYTIDASVLEPQLALPHTVDNVFPLSQAMGTPVQQAFLGTCTNGRLEDLAVAASLLKGRQVSTSTRFLVIPASALVLRDGIRKGYVEILLEAGAVIGPPGCGPCMGNHFGVPAEGEVTISTANRNFRGRMGTRESAIFLASPAVVAASAVAGEIAHPADV